MYKTKKRSYQSYKEFFNPALDVCTRDSNTLFSLSHSFLSLPQRISSRKLMKFIRYIRFVKLFVAELR